MSLSIELKLVGTTLGEDGLEEYAVAYARVHAWKLALATWTPLSDVKYSLMSVSVDSAGSVKLEEVTGIHVNQSPCKRCQDLERWAPCLAFRLKLMTTKHDSVVAQLSQLRGMAEKQETSERSPPESSRDKSVKVEAGAASFAEFSPQCPDAQRDQLRSEDRDGKSAVAATTAIAVTQCGRRATVGIPKSSQTDLAADDPEDGVLWPKLSAYLYKGPTKHLAAHASTQTEYTAAGAFHDLVHDVGQMIIQNRAEESETSGEEYVSNRRRHHSVSSYASQADRGQVSRPRAPSSDERHEGGGEPDDDWEISDDEVDDAEDVNASKEVLQRSSKGLRWSN
ncbi:hypothetical protein FOZ60_006162 [Perkinsus olseni]|uniref:Uncharacterized protein n=1 Tax=Perkinsus olseni TaxID=32597 RepID=A0A7J6PHS5_PEROL|nr:hypothetical protein FOZ60_006162 [Perkinsus olseni]